MTQPIEGKGASAVEAELSRSDVQSECQAPRRGARERAADADLDASSAVVGSGADREFDVGSLPDREPGTDPATAAIDSAEPAADAAAAVPEAGEAPVGADGVGAGDALTDVELVSAIAALVYASPEPISERRLQALLEGPRLERIRLALATLRERLGNSGLPYELRTLAGGYQILTTPDVGEIVLRLAKVRKTERISGAALETLAVVAYRQPVSKAEVEAIRGVQAGPILRTLIERGLVRVSGRSDDPGHPLQYGTTKEFLDRFGLGSLADLPRDGELARD